MADLPLEDIVEKIRQSGGIGESERAGLVEDINYLAGKLKSYGGKLASVFKKACAKGSGCLATVIKYLMVSSHDPSFELKYHGENGDFDEIAKEYETYAQIMGMRDGWYHKSWDEMETDLRKKQEGKPSLYGKSDVDLVLKKISHLRALEKAFKEAGSRDLHSYLIGPD